MEARNAQPPGLVESIGSPEEMKELGMHTSALEDAVRMQTNEAMICLRGQDLWGPCMQHLVSSEAHGSQRRPTSVIMVTRLGCLCSMQRKVAADSVVPIFEILEAASHRSWHAESGPVVSTDRLVNWRHAIIAIASGGGYGPGKVGIYSQTTDYGLQFSKKIK